LGEKFIVELQKAKQNYFKDRSVYYSTFPIQEQAQKGEWDYQLTAVYTVGILDFVFDENKNKNNEELLHIVKLKDTNNRIFYDKLTYIYIELPKFSKNDAELESRFDKWIYIFKHLANLQNRPPALQEKIFEKLFETAEIAKFSPKEIELYEGSLKHYRALKNIIDTSKAEGIEIGIELGVEKGMELGEQQKSLNVAKEMKADGVPIAKIMKYTGLTEGEIRNL